MSQEPEPIGLEAELPTGELAVAARSLVRERLRGVRRAIERDVAPRDVVVTPTRSESRDHLLREACELYWNELHWESANSEEAMGDEEFTEMVFPGLLSLLDALLPTEENGQPDRDRERRDVIHDFLFWLGGRLVELRGTTPVNPLERSRTRREARMTAKLMDLVIYRVYGLRDEEIDRLEGR